MVREKKCQEISIVPPTIWAEQILKRGCHLSCGCQLSFIQYWEYICYAIA